MYICMFVFIEGQVRPGAMPATDQLLDQGSINKAVWWLGSGCRWTLYRDKTV